MSLGWLPYSLLCIGIFAYQLIQRLRESREPVLNWPSTIATWLKAGGMQVASSSCAIAAVLLLVEMWEDSKEMGGAGAHALELGLCGTLLSLCGFVWTAGADGSSVFPHRSEGETTTRSRYLAVFIGLGSLFCFGALIWLISQQPVQAADQDLLHRFYQSGGSAITSWMKQISNSGGGEFSKIWIPVVVIGLILLHRARAVRYLLFSVIGAAGLQTIFKAAILRPRPDLTRGVHLDSFPSGHVLAAGVFAGTLVVLLWHSCRNAVWRALLCTAAVSWTLLMALSRMYLGRHYLTDVLAALFLAAAWVSLVQVFFVLMVDLGVGRRTANPSKPNEAVLGNG
jgi:undecaprenyl-diphosphatase